MNKYEHLNFLLYTNFHRFQGLSKYVIWKHFKTFVDHFVFFEKCVTNEK